MPSKYKGYMGEYALVDLTNGEVSRYEVPDEERELYLGNKIQAAAILHKLLKPEIDPFSADNVLVFNTGPLTGSGAPTSAKFNISCKSPLTGAAASSNCGGDFGIHLKKAGYDGIIVIGKAANPVYLKITEKTITLEDASHLWGKDTHETQAALPQKSGLAVIGPAGENLVLYANVHSGDRAAGRCGIGAVMGSKNLKAVVAQGTKKIERANDKQFLKAIKEWTKILRNHPITGDVLPRLGTANLVRRTNETYTLPTRNFMRGTFEFAEDVSGETMAEKFLVKNHGCKLCPIQCGRVVRYKDMQVKGPEFETIGNLGPNLEIHDLGKIIEWNYLLEKLGMDTISTGGVLAFAMELKSRGMLDTVLEFGKTEHITETIMDIAYKRGLGAELGLGTKRLADIYGGHAFAMNTKGLEYAAYEPRGAVGHGLGYATANRGGCHLNGGYVIFFEATGPITMDPLTPKAKPAFCMFQQNAFEAVSASGTCIFTTYATVPPFASELKRIPALQSILSELLKLSRFIMDHQGDIPTWLLPFHLPLIPQTKSIAALTGMDMSLGKFLAIGDRGFNLERLFNLKAGLTQHDDSLPSRLTDEPQRPAVPNSKVPLAEMLPVYYKIRGWDEHGVPTPKKLKALGLEWV